MLETNFIDSPPPVVMADPVQLQQVILNLIMNAIEAMSASEHGARVLRIETSIDQANSVVITVADSGPGFDAKAGEQLFKPFFTTKSSGMSTSALRISLATAPLPCGRKWFFICPALGVRARALYLPGGARYFRSRQAYNLAYETEHLDDRERAWRRVRKCHRQLGSDPDGSASPTLRSRRGCCRPDTLGCGPAGRRRG